MITDINEVLFITNVTKTIFLLLFLILLSTSLYAAPPFVQTNVGISGLQIRTTPYDYVKQNQDFTANFHVFNLSDGTYKDNTTVTCYLHLYDHAGHHLYTSQITKFDHDFDFEINIDKNNFSEIGQHAYIVQCNESNAAGNPIQGGFLSSVYQVTRDGLEERNPFTLSIIFTSIMVILFFLLLGITNKNPIYAWASFIFAFFQVLFTLFYSYLSYLGGDISGLLKFNYIMFFIVGFFVLFLSLFRKTLVMISFDEDTTADMLDEKNMTRFDANTGKR